MAKKSSPGTRANRQKKFGLVGRNRKKISQITNAYLYLPFFLLISSVSFKIEIELLKRNMRPEKNLIQLYTVYHGTRKMEEYRAFFAIF
jgi:hypothetical protein